MKRHAPVWVLGVALAACNGEPAPQPTPTATPSPTASASATQASNGAREVAEETDDFLFKYAYPAEVGRIAELASLLDVQAEQQRERLAAEAAAARRAAREEGFPYNKHSYTAEWQVVADLPGWLSLSSEVATYEGGAHGNYTTNSLMWDKEAERAMNAKRLFVSEAALEEAFGDRFCDGLDREREKRRGGPPNEEEEGAQNSFVDCPKIGELEVLVGSSNRRTFNRLTVYAGPYVAGPYAEGAYEVNLNIDAAILEAVKPEFRAAFSTRN
jgi:hypothetical protein